MQNDSNPVSKQSTSKTQFPKDPYSGGRHLNAIVFSDKLKTLEKHLMLTIGSQLDFRDVLHSKRFMSVKQLAKMMSCSIRTIHNLTASLKANGYILIESRFDDVDERQKSNFYSLTAKIFVEHCAKLDDDDSVGDAGGDARNAGGRVHDVQTDIPNKELPPEEEKTISKDIVKNFENDCEKASGEKSAPKKSPKTKSRADLNKALGYIGAMFKPDGSPETKGFPWPNKQQIEAVASTLVDKYGLAPIKVWFDQANDEGLLGRLRWTPSKFDSHLKLIVTNQHI